MSLVQWDRALHAIRKIADEITTTAAGWISGWMDWALTRSAGAVGGASARPFEIRASTLPEGESRGFALWDVESDRVISWPEWGEFTQGKLESVPVAGGAEHHHFALQLEAFMSGSRLSLVREVSGPRGEGTLAVFDASGKHRVGYVPSAYTAAAGRAMIAGSTAFVAWETIDEGERVGLRVCLVAPEILNRFQSVLTELKGTRFGEIGDPRPEVD